MFGPVSICSLIVAAVALWVAWDWRRKSTQHVFLLIRVSSGFTQSVEHPNGYQHFKMYIRNLGLPFPRMSVVLGFREPNGKGWMSCPLRAVDIRTKHSSDSAINVATGEVVQFAWRTYEMDVSEIRFLQALHDLRKQKAVLTVYSCGYIVGTMNPGSLPERIKSAWHQCVSAACRKLKLGIDAANQDSWKARIKTPDSQSLSFALSYFVEQLRKKESSNNGVQPTK